MCSKSSEDVNFKSMHEKMGLWSTVKDWNLINKYSRTIRDTQHLHSLFGKVSGKD
jgi:hypothetical protein